MPRLPSRRDALLSALPVCAVSLIAQDGSHPQGSKPSAQPALANAIGVVDFVQVLQAYPNYLKGSKQLEEEKKARQAILSEEEGKLQELKIKRDGVRPGTRDYNMYTLDLDCAMRHLNGFRDILGNDLDQLTDKLMAQSYEEIEQVVAKIARDRSLLLVLRLHRDLADSSPRAKAITYDRRVVWCAVDEIDLTAEVIKQLQAGPPSAPAKADPGKDAATPKGDRNGKEK